jgi:hypothetical protein
LSGHLEQCRFPFWINDVAEFLEILILVLGSGVVWTAAVASFNFSPAQ